MHAQVKKSKANKGKAVANTLGQDKSDGRQGLGFVDNRPEAFSQSRLHKTVENYQQNSAQMKYERNSPQDVIQRVGNYSPNITINAVSPTSIAELEYGVGKAIKFTGISSCIGVIGKRGSVLVAVHLPLVDNSGTSVSSVGATQLGNAVGNIMAGCDSVYIVGEKPVWLGSGAKMQYNKVKSVVGGTEFPMGSGSYAAFLDNGDGRNQILLYFNGEQIWPMEF